MIVRGPIGGDEVNDDDKEIVTEGKNDDTELNDIDSIRKEIVKIEDDERNLLKKMAQSAQEDINKGKHVKTQLGLWDTFLDIRVKFQKAVTISNSFPQYNMYSQFITTSDTKDLIHETKIELKELLDSLINLQKDLCINNENISISNDIVINRKRHHGNENDYLDYFWNDMQEIHKNFLPYRTQTIDKWNNKVQIASGIPLNKKFKAINQSVNTHIEQILQDQERLIKRTQLKRNTERILGKVETNNYNNNKINSQENPPTNSKKYDEHLSNHDEEIFDDTDFYQQLLKELMDNRMIDTDDPIALGLKWTEIKKAKQKKKPVDTKASKGRKLRYHTHEKLQNFMVPIPASTWHKDMIDELYASLLGKKYEAIKDEVKDKDENENENENAMNQKDITNKNLIEEKSRGTKLDGLKIFG